MRVEEDAGVSNGDGHGVILDPSFALSEEGAAFLGEGAEGEIERFAVSRSFVEALGNGGVPDLSAWFPEAGLPIDPLFLREVLGGARLFSHEEVEVEEPRVAEIRDALLGELSPTVAEILADQWVFLQTQSWRWRSAGRT